MTQSQYEIMEMLGNLYRTGKAINAQEDELCRDMACGPYSFGGVRPVEKAKQAVDEWRRLRKQKP